MKYRIFKWLVVSLAAISLFTFLYIKEQFKPVELTTSTEVKITIPKGSNTIKIAKILKEHKLIRNELAFRFYVRYLGYDMHLKAGTYDLAGNMSLDEIIQKLVVGNNNVESVRFTIPEGYNVKQIAERLSNQGLIDKDKFLQLIKDADFAYDFVKQIPQNENIEFKLEGYLFPETYEIRKGATEEEIINKMLAQFEKEIKPEWTQAIKKKQMTLNEIITLASIIEREVVVDKERPIVAGVFYNRLNNSWNLQSCATVQFVLGKQKDRLTYDDLEINHPYNTYVNPGLPPGPIGSPGRKSIEAAIFPAEHDYFFFVTKKDQSGEHFFAKTFTEHLNNDAKSKGNW